VGFDGKAIPVFQAESFEALEQPAIDQKAAPITFDQVPRPGDRAGGSEE
jgi:hypothetical protein